MVNKWALLCGGDFYLPPKPAVDEKGEPRPAPRNLKGCVQDVQAIRNVLLSRGVPRKNIRMLTASSGLRLDQPIEKKRRWPTWENIKRELSYIEKAARDGDLVYFHYSGHGSMRQDIQVEEENGTEDGIKSGTALVMTDVYQDGPYLTGRHLGTWLEAMVTKKAIRVTVVLDSCHSGAAFRHGDVDADDGDVRTLEGLPTRQVDMDADTECNAQANESTRDPGSLRSCWLSNPTSCAILTACGSHEFAAEQRFGENRHGVLTYHLLKFLKSSEDRPPSHERAVEYIRRGIKGRVQTPSAHGDVLFEFFGNYEYSTGETCNAIFMNGRIELNIGDAQGVAVGAQYDIHPAEGSLDAERSPPLKVTVTNVFNFRSWAEPVQKSDVLNWPSNEIRRAHLTQWALQQPVYVHAPSIQAEQQDELGRELKLTPGLGFTVDQHQQQQNVDLVVSIGQGDTYEIRQDGNLLPRLPRILVRDESWAVKLARVLSHVARFQDLRRKFTTTATSQRLGGFSMSATPDRVQTGEDVNLKLLYPENQSLYRLCVSLYCFSESWVIYKLHPGAGLAADREFWEEFREGISVTMDFPEKLNESDPDEVKDLFVFFVAASDSRGTPSWGDISLPRLTLSASHAGREWHAPEEEDPEEEEGRLNKLSTKAGVPDPTWTVVRTPVWTTPR